MVQTYSYEKAAFFSKSAKVLYRKNKLQAYIQRRESFTSVQVSTTEGLVMDSVGREMTPEEKDFKTAGDIGEQIAKVVFEAVHGNKENCEAAGRKLGEMVYDADNAPLA